MKTELYNKTKEVIVAYVIEEDYLGSSPTKLEKILKIKYIKYFPILFTIN